MVIDRFSTDQFTKKIFSICFLFLSISCNKGYHYKYWIFPYHNNLKLDLSSRPDFKITNTDFAIDRYHVYYNEHLLTGVDPASLVLLNREIFKDKNGVYSISTNTEIKTNSPKAWIILIPLDLKVWTESKTILLKMELADPKSFILLKKGDTITNYGTDNKRLFYGANFLIETSNEKPEFLNSPFLDLLKIGNHLFYEGEKIDVADAESFQLFDHYAKDNQNCFYLDYRLVKKFTCNVATFQPLRFPNPLDSKIEMDSGYAIDQHHVYWEGTIVQNAIIENFQLISKQDDCVADGYCGSDGLHRYEGGVEK